MSKFTPGKWNIDRFGDIVDEHGSYIAQLHERFDNTNEEKEANSRLIAAAPTDVLNENIRLKENSVITKVVIIMSEFYGLSLFSGIQPADLI